MQLNGVFTAFLAMHSLSTSWPRLSGRGAHGPPTAAKYSKRQAGDWLAKGSLKAGWPIAPPRTEKVVDAACRLSAILHLAGAEGYALEDNDNETLERWIPVSLVDPEGDPAIGAALRTKMFSGMFGERRFVPAHAHLAAFLGAQHLARLVRRGVLPTGRLLSLLEGGDGAPPTPLRGLVGWLAALSPELRPTLIRSDPVATLLYGDASSFEQSEKNQLIHEIGRAYAGLHFWPPFAVAALATPDFEEDLRTVLRKPASSDEERAALLTVLTAIANAAPLPRLTPELLPIVREERHPPDIRVTALDAWIHVSPEERKTEHLTAMLDELRGTTPADVARELVGTLLQHVYPGRLRPHRGLVICRRPREPPRRAVRPVLE